MIRAIEKRDSETVCGIVNENWRTVYSGYVDPVLLSREGCMRRSGELIRDFVLKRFSEYVYEENGEVLGMVSFGKTEESDLPESFEVWRLYVSCKAKQKGIGSRLLEFAEEKAVSFGYKTIIIWAFKENFRALSFYEKHGYHIDREEYLDEPYGAVGVRFIKKIQ